MKRGSFLSSVTVAAILLIGTGCASLDTSDPVTGAAAGGLGLGVVGAGTGALVGAVIANGDIGASALLGTAVAVPIGVAAGAYYVYSMNESELDSLDSEILDNKDIILENQAQIEELRREIIEDSHQITPDKSLGEHIYTTPSIGNYYR